MKIKFLGTSDGFGVPSLYCSCDNCNYARTHKGKDVRTPSQILINEDMLIDLPYDTLCNQNTFNIDFSKIRYLLITNNHPSKLHPFSLIARGSDNHPATLFPIEIFGSMPSIDTVFDSLRKAGVNNQNRWKLNEVLPFCEFSPDGYKITPLKANNEFRLFPYIYSIQSFGKRVLFAQSSGLFLKETLDFLKSSKLFFNIVVLDCTEPYGKTDELSFHMNLDNCRYIKKLFLQNNYADESSIFVLTHFSHKNSAYHNDLEKDVEGDGFIIAYDGLEINI